MKLRTAAGIGLALVALVTCILVAYKTLSVPGQHAKIDQICLNPACGAEFQLDQAEMNRLSRAHQAIVCPKCGSADTGKAERCPSCERLNPPLDHSSGPPKCLFCKKPWNFAAPARQKP